MGSRDKTNSTGLSRQYSTALRKHLALGPRASRGPAAKLGRQALASGLGTLDLARIHQQALMGLAPSGESSKNNHTAGRAATFLVDALTPLEKNHRAAARSNGSSSRSPSMKRQQSAQLFAAKLLAKREAARAKGLETALKKSKQHYSLLLAKAVHMQEHLRYLSHRVLSAQEEERKQISRELHDEIGQMLTGITVKLATLKKEAAVNTKGLKKKIASTQRLLEKSMKIVHRFARELRPPLLDDLGLIPALHSFMKDFTRRTHIPIVYTASATVEQLSSDKRIVLYRVAQEALSNVAKHAHASRVSVIIERLDGGVRMKIHDNGKAFQAQRVLSAKKVTRLGLLGMRERVEMVGGDFQVESAAGKGTTVCAQIPARAGS